MYSLEFVMRIQNVINWPILIVAFVLGLAYIKYFHPSQRKVVVYPKPDNVEKIQYQDTSESIFEYRAIPINCDKADNITKYPVQN